MEWYQMVLQKYAQFAGRSRRKEYWMFALINAIIYCVLYAVAFGSILMGSKAVSFLLFTLCIVYALGTVVPGLAVSVRRLHDTNKSGWLLLVALVPFVGGIILIVLMAIDGDPGPNQYGPNPKQFAQPATIA
jgi:uncharacterized membrane protein YhaH (DUF805 family)